MNSNYLNILVQAVRRGMTHVLVKKDGTVQHADSDREDVVERVWRDRSVHTVLAAPRHADPSDVVLERHASEVSRRNFLRMAGIGALFVVASPMLEHLAPVRPASSMITALPDREMAIAYALDSTEGRTVLARAMVEPIRQSLMYQSIGRKLLLVDELPAGAIARYERDMAVLSYRTPLRNGLLGLGLPETPSQI